jgi:polysaccharide biosynthesis/export protein
MINRTRLIRLHAMLLAIFAVTVLVGSDAKAQGPPRAANRPTSEQSAVDSSYVLGPGDTIVVRCLEAEEFADNAIRIADDGVISLPLIGRVNVGGLTLAEAERTLTERLQVFMKHPAVTVNAVEFRSQPVTVTGAVNTPGLHYLTGRKTLLEILSMAGGVKPDAGYGVKLIRKKQWGPIPLASAAEDESHEFTVAELNLRSLMSGSKPAENIEIRPYDVISVPRANLIYVLGEVRKPGGFALNDTSNITVLQALSMSEGLLHTASPRKAKILRRTAEIGQRTEIPIDLNDILRGRKPDLAMTADDILLVPDNAPKSVGLRTIEAMVQAGTGVLIYRR